MHESRFPCPCCAAPLKVRGRHVVGMRIDCPDCHRPLQIKENPNGKLVAVDTEAEIAQAPPALSQDKGSTATDANRKSRRRVMQAAAQQSAHVLRRINPVDRLKNPLVIAWSAATLMTLALVVAILPKDRPTGWRSRNVEKVARADAAANKATPAKGIDVKRPAAIPPANAKQPADAMKPVDQKETAQPTESSAVAAPKPIDATEPPVRAEQPKENAKVPVVTDPPPPPADDLTYVPADAEPVIPVAAPKPLNIPQRLSLSVARVQHKQDVPFREFLLELEEMCGFPIRYESAQLTRPVNYLEKPVQLSLANTNIEAILEAALSQVGLAYEIEFDGIRLVPAEKK